MALSSMTGFARASGEVAAFSWLWEVKSVNARGLDIRLRLPGGFDLLEPELRQRITARLKRGSVQVFLQIRAHGAEQALNINRGLLEQLLAEARHLARRLGAAPENVDAAALLSVRGVVEPAQVDFAALAEEHAPALLAGFEEALQRLAEARAEEGARLKEVIAAQLEEIGRLVQQARAHPALRPENIRQRLREQVARLLEASEQLDEQRLHQEALLLAVKTDITEELDRLQSHLQAARELLTAEGPVGRKLEFLAQEFNREANTMCAKAVDAEIAAIGVALKTVIDRFREQVANIE